MMEPGVVIVQGKDGKKQIQINQEKDLLQLLQKNNIFLDAPCNGKGKCGKCKIRFISKVPETKEIDKKHLTQQEIIKGYRLACTTVPKDGMEITVKEEPDTMKVLDSSYSVVEVEYLNPAVIKKYFDFTKSKVENQQDDVEGLVRRIGAVEVPYSILKKLPEVFKNGYKGTATIFNRELIHIETEDSRDQCYGLAVDIGTTTIVIYLLDLLTGEVLGIASGMNEQRPYGADVLSRTQFSIENQDGSLILQKVMINQLNEMINRVIQQNHIEGKYVYQMVVVGNPTMLHMLLGISARNIAIAPYRPVFTQGYTISALELGVHINGKITILPSISGYIGADITAGILAAGLDKNEEYSLLLDLGTNGEIVLGNENQSFTCSTAAGPAFEGGSIKYGIGGVRGAISAVDFEKTPIIQTIDDAEPCGICGSGVLDTVAQLFEHGLMDETGRILNKGEIGNNSYKELIGTDEDGKRYIVLDSERNIFFTQKDVREVQLAKAAIYGGIHTLLKEAKIQVEDVKNVYIAGGFGSYMRMKSAVSIGLIPGEFQERTHPIGNAAGSGAKMCLLSKDYIPYMEISKKKTKHIELSMSIDFQDYFVEGMNIGKM